MSQGSWFWKEAGCRKDFFDIVWSKESKCQACHKEEGTEMHRLYHCPGCNEVRRPNPRGPQEVVTKSENVEEGMEAAKRYCYASSK